MYIVLIKIYENLENPSIDYKVFWAFIDLPDDQIAVYLEYEKYSQCNRMSIGLFNSPEPVLQSTHDGLYLR